MKPRTVTTADLRRISVALNYLRDARAALRRAGATNAAAYVSRALKSAEGAARHADNLYHRQHAREEVSA